MFGYDDGNTVLIIDQSSRSIALDVQERPLKKYAAIHAYAKADADKLGMLFNDDYFGSDNSYNVGMTLTTADFLTVDGRFELSTALKTVQLAEEAAPATTAATRRWLIAGNDLNAFVGLNGPYRIDTDHDGDLNDEATNASAVGFELTGVDIALALYLEDGVTDADAPQRGWVSLSATSKTATEVGLPMMTVDARNLAVDINIGTDLQTVVDYTRMGAVKVPIGQGEFITLNHAGSLGTLIRASGDFDVSVADFFYASGSMGFEKSTRDVVLADGTAVRANTLAIGADGLKAFAGVNGPYFLADGKTNPDSLGLELNDVDFGLTLMSPAKGQDSIKDMRWVSLKASAGEVAFVGIPDVTLAARDLAVDINLVTGVADGVDADTRVVDFTNENAPISVVTGTGKSMKLDMPGTSGRLVRASGDIDLKLGDFVELSGSAGFERRAQNVTLADGTSLKTQLISVGGTGLSGFVGVGPYRVDLNGDGQIDDNEINPNAHGLGIRDVEFGLGLFSSPVAGYTDIHWTALTASVGHVDALVGLPPDIRLDVHSLGIDINRVSGVAAGSENTKVIDFAGEGHGVDLVTGTGKHLTLTHDGNRGQLLRASGGMALDVAGYFHVDGTLSVEKSSLGVTLADGSTAKTQLLTVGGTGLEGFIGVNGPYRTDTNHDGKVDLNDTPNPKAIGLSATGIAFGLGLFFEQDAATQRTWTSLKASVAEVALVGVPGLTASASKLAVDINLVDGVAAGTLDRTQVIDFAGKPLLVNTGYRTTVTLDMKGTQGELIRASGSFDLDIAGFVQIRGSLGLEKSNTTVTLADGEQVLVDSLTLGGTGLGAFAGVGGYFVKGSNTPNPNAVGLVVDDAEFALALLSTPSDATTLAGVSWMGMEASGKKIGFVGSQDFELSAKNLDIEINQVFGLKSALDPSTHVVNFKSSPLKVVTGTNQYRTLDIDGSKGQLIHATGDVVVQVGDFFYAGGALGFEKSTRTLVLDDGKRQKHDVLMIGGKGLQAFAGIHGGPLVDSNGDGHINSDDTPGADAVGFSLSGVDLALVVATESDAETPTTRIGLEAEVGAAKVVGIDDLTLGIRDVSVAMNLPDAATGRVIDFKKSNLHVPTGTGSTHTLTLDGAWHKTMSVTAGVSVAISDYVYLDGTAAFEKHSDTLTLADGSHVAVDALTLGANNISAFAGVDGPYRVDSNGDGNITSQDTVNESAVGFSLADVDVALGLFQAQNDQKDAKGVSLDGVSWTALTAHAAGVEVVNLPVSVSATNINIAVNQVNGLASGLDVDTHVADFSGGYAIRTGIDSHLSLNMPGSKGSLLQVNGTMSVNVAGWVTLNGALSFEQSKETLTLSDGTTVDTRLLVVGGKDVSATLSVADTTGLPSFALTNLDFGLAVATASAPGDSRSWLTLEGSVESVGVYGLEQYGITLEGHDLAVSLNTGLGNTKTAIDWSGAHSRAVGDVTLNAKGQEIIVAGTLNLGVGDVMSAEGTARISLESRNVLVGKQTVAVTGFYIGAAEVSANVSGIAVEGLDLGMAVMRPADATNTDTRTWLALAARVDGVSIDAAQLGLPSAITASASSLTLNLNQGLGRLNGIANDTVMNLSKDASSNRSITVLTGSDTPSHQSLVLDMGASGEEQITLGFDATLAWGTSLSLAGSFALNRPGVRLVTLDDGSRRSMETTLLSATGVSVKVGSGATSTEAGAFVGLQLDNGSIGLAVMKDVATGGTFLGMKASANALSLEGIDVLSASANNIDFSLNSGPLGGELAGRVVDFTKGDIDNNGKVDGYTALATSTGVVKLNLNVPIIAAEATLSLALNDTSKPDAPPILSGSGQFRFEQRGALMVLGGTHLNASINVAGQEAAVRDGTLGLIFGNVGFALSVDATATVSVPGLPGVNLFGDISLDINKTGWMVNQSIVVDGQTIPIKFDNSGSEPHLNLGSVDVTLGGVLSESLTDAALKLSHARADLQQNTDLPLIDQSLDELFQLSSVMNIGDFMLHYMGQPTDLTYLPAVVYGSTGKPTLKGMIGYLNTYWGPQSGLGANLRLNLDGEGFKFGLTGALDVNVSNLKLDLSDLLGGIPLKMDTALSVDAHLKAALDFDFSLDWTEGLNTRFDVRKLSFDGAISANNVVVQAGFGPMSVSVGRKDVPGQKYQRGSLSASLAGGLTYVDGVFNVEVDASKNRVDVYLPLYASVAGVDLVGQNGLVPSISVKGNPFGALDVQTQYLDQFTQFNQIKAEDIIMALPNILNYLESVNADSLGLGQLPFLEKSADQVLDLATAFKTQVVDKIDFYKPREAWKPALGEVTTAKAAGKATLNADATQLSGKSGQFAASMVDQWITVGNQPYAVKAVSQDGSSLSIAGQWTGQSGDVSYLVHLKPVKITTMGEFIDAVNASGLLGDQKASYDPVRGEVTVPIRFAYLLSMDDQIGMQLGDGENLDLSVSSTGHLGVNLSASLDLIIGVNKDFSLAIDHLAVGANFGLSAKDIEARAKLGFVGLKAGGVGTRSDVELIGQVGVTLDRTPNDTTTGTRFSFDELLNEGLSSLNFDVSGSAHAGIRGLSVLAGQSSFDLAPDLEFAIDVPNLGKWDKV
ncbi:MAG: beta strand repeat-containing protein [Methylococcaceae bacterium]